MEEVFVRTRARDNKCAGYGHLICKEESTYQILLNTKNFDFQGRSIVVAEYLDNEGSAGSILDRKLLVKHLDIRTTDQDLSMYFGRFGKLKMAYIIGSHGRSQVEKLHGIVVFEKAKCAEHCLRKRKHCLLGKQIKVRFFSKKKKNEAQAKLQEHRKRSSQHLSQNSGSGSEAKDCSSLENSSRKELRSAQAVSIGSSKAVPTRNIRSSQKPSCSRKTTGIPLNKPFKAESQEGKPSASNYRFGTQQSFPSLNQSNHCEFENKNQNRKTNNNQSFNFGLKEGHTVQRRRSKETYANMSQNNVDNAGENHQNHRIQSGSHQIESPARPQHRAEQIEAANQVSS